MRNSCFWVERRGYGGSEIEKVVGWLERLIWVARRDIFFFSLGVASKRELS